MNLDGTGSDEYPQFIIKFENITDFSSNKRHNLLLTNGEVYGFGGSPNV
jgi:hypothetical protein